MGHECSQEIVINDLRQRITKLEERVDNVKELLKDIKDFQNRLTWWLIGTFGTSILTLIIIVIKGEYL